MFRVQILLFAVILMALPRAYSRSADEVFESPIDSFESGHDSGKDLKIAKEKSGLSDFSFFLKSLIKANGTYRGALEDYNAARELRSGIPGFYLPRLTGSLIHVDSRAPGNGYNRLLTTTGSVGLAGSVPNLGLSYEFNFFQNIQRNFMNEDVGLLTTNAGTTSMSFELPLLRGWGPSIGTIPQDRLKTNEKIALFNSRLSLLTSTETLLGAYINAIVAEQSLGITEKFLRSSEETTARFVELERVGKSSGLESLNTRVQLQNAKSQLLQAKIRKVQAVAQLNSIAGSKEAPEDVAKLKPIEEAVLIPPKAWLNDVFDPRDFNNPRIEILENQVLLEEYSVRVAENAVLPTLNLTLTQNKVVSPQENWVSIYQQNYFENIAALQFSMPLGMIIERSQREAARASQRGRRAELKQALVSVREDYRAALRELRLTEESHAVAQDTQKYSEERYRASLPTLQLNSTAQFDVLAYQNALQDANVRAIEIKGRLLQARARLFFIRGDLSILSKLGAL